MKRFLKDILLLGLATTMFTSCSDETSSGVSSVGIVKGEFTVAQGKKVYFSQGNLQYQASTNTWRFAEHQWDIIDKENENISSNYDGWIDLFGWGTSGFKGKKPYMTSKEKTDYGDGDNNITGTNYDWGVYDKISNGGDKAGIWRTLTRREWDYILDERPRCAELYSKGRVDGINGLILLPDEWDDSISFSPQSIEWGTNDYTLDEWNLMESHGAVFLPAAGYRNGTSVNYAGSYGYYWSSASYDHDYAGYLHFCSDDLYTGNSGSRRGSGRSVRLVQNVK